MDCLQQQPEAECAHLLSLPWLLTVGLAALQPHGLYTYLCSAYLRLWQNTCCPIDLNSCPSQPVIHAVTDLHSIITLEQAPAKLFCKQTPQASLKSLSPQSLNSQLLRLNQQIQTTG